MKRKEIHYIKACLPEQIPFSYFKDKYAMDLLRNQFEDNVHIQEIKKTRFKALLNRPAVHEILKKSGNGRLRHDHLSPAWSDQTSFFKLTLGRWGEVEKAKSKYSINQVSRPEENLVLQVNFGNEHDLIFWTNLNQKVHECLTRSWHPVHSKLTTLGWVRLDIDMDAGEVLIEEVQNDWIRDLRSLKHQFDAGNHWIRKLGHRFLRYYSSMAPLMKIWDELLLAAALDFVRRELGIHNVWYHTVESNTHYKMLSYSLPPRSIYSKLPSKFCFEKTLEKPGMIQNCAALKKLNKTGKSCPFYQLKLEK